MTAKTGKQIQSDFRQFLQDSLLAKKINGKVYRDGYRPRDSDKEDAVVIFTAGDAERIQQGVVTINIFVKDRDYYGTGQLMEDGERCEQLEKEAARWVEGLTPDTTGYLTELRQTITTDERPEIHQHFIVVVLGFKILTDDNESPILQSEDGRQICVSPEQLKKAQDHAVEITNI